MRKIAAFLLIFSLSLFAEPPPSAKDILASVRMIESQQQIDLQGQLRQNDVVVPFRLVQNGPLIRYSFTNPEEVLQFAPRSCERRWNRKICAFEAQSKNPRHQRDLRGSCLQISLLAYCSRVGRGKCSHSQLLEIATARALARLAVFKSVAVDRQGERRINADGRLRLERATGETLRSRIRSKDRGSLVSETNAGRRIPARHESRPGEDVSGD